MAVVGPLFPADVHLFDEESALASALPNASELDLAKQNGEMQQLVDYKLLLANTVVLEALKVREDSN